MKRVYWIFIALIGIGLAWYMRSYHTMGDYVYVESLGYSNYYVHTDKHCKELDGAVDFVKPYVLYKDHGDAIISYCHECVEDWQYDKLMKTKSIVKYQKQKEE